MPIFCFAIPTLTTFYLLNESFGVAWCACSALRYVIALHGTWLGTFDCTFSFIEFIIKFEFSLNFFLIAVNSAAHKWGSKPFDRFVAILERKKKQID